MDQDTPREQTLAKPAKPARTALGVLALCFALSVIGRGLGESFTVFLKPISESFGWDRADVVSVYSLSALAGGLASPLIGRLFDYSGPRSVYSLGLLLFGGAFLFAANASHLWQIQFSVGIAVGLGIALIGNVPNSILLGRWFGPKLPTAMAVVYSATGAGVLVLLPASQVLIDHVGWRGTYQIFGTTALLLLLPLLILPWRLFSTGSPHVVKEAAADMADEGWTLSRAVRHHAFWALFWTFFFTAIGMYALTPQVVAYLIDAGFPPLQAATAWGFSGVVLLFGMLGVSWLDGIIGRRPSVLLSYAGRNVVIDTTPDFRFQAMRQGIDRLDAIVYTHAHADHILGFDDLRPLSFRHPGRLALYADEPTALILERIFEYTFSPRANYPTRARVNLRRLNGHESADVAGVRFQRVPLLHGDLPVAGFRFGAAAYLTDMSSIPDNSLPLLEDLDVLIIDALRKQPHPSHANIDQALAWVDRLQPRRAFFTHMSHEVEHAETENEFPPHIRLAYDGLRIPFEI